jgi:prepilin peptidase CpaA
MTMYSFLFRQGSTHLEWALVLVIAGIAVCTDLRARRIPNWLTISGMGAGLVLNLLLGGVSGGLHALEGLGLGMALLLLLFLRGGMGGGDVKLLMAIGACGGPDLLFAAFLFGAVFGAGMSAVVLMRKKMLRLALAGVAAQVSMTGLTIPYAVPVAAGVVLEIVRRSTGLF